jgi:hypothetical protein
VLGAPDIPTLQQRLDTRLTKIATLAQNNGVDVVLPDSVRIGITS